MVMWPGEQFVGTSYSLLLFGKNNRCYDFWGEDGGSLEKNTFATFDRRPKAFRRGVFHDSFSTTGLAGH